MGQGRHRAAVGCGGFEKANRPNLLGSQIHFIPRFDLGDGERLAGWTVSSICRESDIHIFSDNNTKRDLCINLCSCKIHHHTHADSTIVPIHVSADRNKRERTSLPGMNN